MPTPVGLQTTDRPPRPSAIARDDHTHESTMTSTTTTFIDAAHDTTRGETAHRLDLYAPIHKALRQFMCDTLVRVGSLDTDDQVAMNRTLDQLATLLTLCRSHVKHEDQHMHPAIEACQPTGTTRARHDHLEHVQAISELRDELGVLRRAPVTARPALALRLYRHLALFVAENLQHMHVEETAHNALLWSHYDDAALGQLHGRILADLPFDETLLVMRWMVPALTPAERHATLAEMQAGMPAPVFQQVLDTVQPHLDTQAWARLCRALGLAPVPGLVEA